MRFDLSYSQAELAALIDAERDRRMGEDLIFDGRAFQAGPKARQAIYEAALGATGPIDWISADNSVLAVDILALARAIAARNSLIALRARALKDRASIPIDFANDTHWQGDQP